jgi:glycosyltransferase involved in cell wall biosynthesis
MPTATINRALPSANDLGVTSNPSRRSRLKVALVSPSYLPQLGGVEMHVSRLARELSRLGCEVHVLAQVRHENRNLAPFETDGEIFVHRFPDQTRSDHFLVAPSLWQYLRASGKSFDLIHAHSFHAAPALMAAVATRQPYVLSPHYHGVGHTRMARLTHRIYDPLAKYAFHRASAVVCVSSAEADLIRRAYPSCSPRIHIVPNVVESGDLQNAIPYDTDRAVVLFVGRIEKYKQVDHLIDAVELLSDDIELVIVGDGPERPEIARRASRSGARVRVLGRVEDHVLHRWQRTATVAVSLSLNEAFGIVIAEGLAAGASVVASDIAAHREIVVDHSERTELVAPNASAHEIASAISRALCRERESAPGYGDGSWGDVAERICDLYRQSLKL